MRSNIHLDLLLLPFCSTRCQITGLIDFPRLHCTESCFNWPVEQVIMCVWVGGGGTVCMC